MEQYAVAQDYTYIEQDYERLRREMTLPDERYAAVVRAEALLKQLCNPNLTPRVPKAVRQEAAAILRHYPSRWEMDHVAEQIPSLFQQQMEELYRTVLLWEQQKNSLDQDSES